MSDKSARRAFVRRHHPDVGGDSDTFREGLQKYDAALVAEPTPAQSPPPAPVASPPPAAARVPVTDRAARGLGRLAARVAALPQETKAAYREGRDGDTPLS